jgi:hypothetical protein
VLLRVPLQWVLSLLEEERQRPMELPVFPIFAYSNLNF